MTFLYTNMQLYQQVRALGGTTTDADSDTEVLVLPMNYPQSGHLYIWARRQGIPIIREADFMRMDPDHLTVDHPPVQSKEYGAW